MSIISSSKGLLQQIMNAKDDMILIAGVTASGKGKLAFGLAKETSAEIISIDSMKVYRRMDVGTAKPPKEARKCVNYHLLDVVEPSEAFSAGAFIELAHEAIKQIKQRQKRVIAVGGTALYIKALLYGLFEGPGANEQIRLQLHARAEKEGLEKLYTELLKADPAAAERISPNDLRRIVRALEIYQITGRPISHLQKQFEAEKTVHDWTIIGLRREKSVENSRINARVKKMIEAGLIDEVKALLAEEKPLSKQAKCAIGYAEIIEHLNGKTTLEEAIEQIKKNTRRLAKHQRTWFKRFRNINWLDIDPEEPVEEIFKRARKLLDNLR
jgi:tRNA dimethylallyltransferase